MVKYNQIMEYIKVTDDMQERILRNARKHFSKRRKAKRVWFSVIGCVAAVVILFAVNPWKHNSLITNPNIQNRPPIGTDSSTQDQPSVGQGIYDRQEYKSDEELSAAVGFTISDLTNIPFEFSEAFYYNVAGYAEIQYVGDENTLIFVKSVGTEDNSGDYNGYPVVKNVNVKNIQATIKGKKNGFYLAIWSDGEYSYSLLCENSTTEKSIIKLIEEIITK